MSLDLFHRPETIVTNTSEESLEVCQRAERGEFHIHSASVGKRNAQWIYQISWPEVKAPVQDPLL